MTGAELKSIRLHLGLSLTQFAHAIGYTGDFASGTLAQRESGTYRVSPQIARLALMFILAGGVPKQFYSGEELPPVDLDGRAA